MLGLLSLRLGLPSILRYSHISVSVGHAGLRMTGVRCGPIGVAVAGVGASAVLVAAYGYVRSTDTAVYCSDSVKPILTSLDRPPRCFFFFKQKTAYEITR